MMNMLDKKIQKNSFYLKLWALKVGQNRDDSWSPWVNPWAKKQMGRIHPLTAHGLITSFTIDKSPKSYTSQQIIQWQLHDRQKNSNNRRLWHEQSFAKSLGFIMTLVFSAYLAWLSVSVSSIVLALSQLAETWLFDYIKFCDPSKL